MMTVKSMRHKKILEIIGANTVSTQEELQELLRNAGFSTTQATISRDIRELRLIKILSHNGSYYYSTHHEQTTQQIPVSLNAVFLESIKSVDFAGNITVIKCFSGMANAVCATIDTGKWDGLVGTLSGDDTVFLLMRTVEQAEEFADYIKDTIQNLK